MRSLGWLALVVVLACAPGAGDETTTTPGTPPATGGSATTSTTIEPANPSAGCSEDQGFVDAGRVMSAGQATSDTNTLGPIAWLVEHGCERLTVQFETTEGAPATTPPEVVAEFLDSRHVLRIRVDVGSTVVTDQLMETPLIDRLFVVRALDGGMFIDLHLHGPAKARAEVSTSPARLTLELEAGAQALDTAAVIEGNTVLISPSDGAQPSAGAIGVSGYARVFEANVLVVASIGGQTVAQTTTTAADWTETWGEFRAQIQLPPGEVSLFVGEEGPDDGSRVGATINLTVR
ncbi:MAG: Gmad2 immunoglobulin-like domain-containing protein [Acidimicrobiia bacterium]